MPSPKQSKVVTEHEKDDREKRLRELSGAMAVARLSHQVKELEHQKERQEKLVRPTFTPIDAVVYIDRKGTC
jgi:hypothetical protein